MATLGYWGIRGLAQPLRFLLAYLGVEYSEKLYTDRETWFEKDKVQIGFDFPNIPYYVDSEIKLTESTAIPYYLIKKNKKPELLGQSADGSYNEKEVRVVQLIAFIKDINKELMGLCFSPDVFAQKDKIYTEKLSAQFTKLVTYLGDKEFLVGTLTYADFIFYELANYFKHIFPQSITPTVTAFLNRFENLPGIKQYIAKPTVDLKVFLPPGICAWHGPQ